MNTISKSLRLGSAAAAFLLAPAIALAAPHALIVGVGDYKSLDSDLPGIDIDMDMMREVASHLGIDEANVRVLENSAATYDAVKTSFTEWLPSRVARNDLVLVYFSGHGTRVRDRNGDEDDEADEALLPYDFSQRSNPRPGESALQNLIVDDEFGQWLAQIPSDNVLVFVDACHSGTVTRGFRMNNKKVASEGFPKFYDHGELPPGRGDAIEIVKDAREENSANYAAVTATKDTQYAITTISGSYFTLGLHKTIGEAVASGQPLTLTELRASVADYIKTRVDAERVYEPSLSGSSRLMANDIGLQRVTDGHGPRWEEYASFVAGARPLELKTPAVRYRVGDKISFSIEIPKAGYLNVVSIDATDKTTVLYPNQHHEMNNLQAGTFAFPTAEMTFDLEASEPAGPTLVAAFVTDEAIHAYALGLEGRDELGVMRSVLTEASPQATRAIAVVSRKPQKTYHAGTIEIEIDAR